jgi:ABC-type sugar transport system ATPase subunit
MHETNPEARSGGQIAIGGIDIYTVPAGQIRRKVGMVFQKANPFPTMSIYDNVAAGLNLNGIRNRKVLDDVVHRSLQEAACWDEVKDISWVAHSEHSIGVNPRTLPHASRSDVLTLPRGAGGVVQCAAVCSLCRLMQIELTENLQHFPK